MELEVIQSNIYRPTYDLLVVRFTWDKNRGSDTATYIVSAPSDCW